jgi:hypothetical protein
MLHRCREMGIVSSLQPRCVLEQRSFAEPVYSWEEQRLLQAGAGAAPTDLIWFQPEARGPKQENWPLNVIFHGVRVAFLRSAWEDLRRLLVGFICGRASSHRSHVGPRPLSNEI